MESPIQKGETLVVSRRRCATGSIVGQIGKIHGCLVHWHRLAPTKKALRRQDLGFELPLSTTASRLKETKTRLRPTASTSILQRWGEHHQAVVSAHESLWPRCCLRTQLRIT